jgi:hypothetical protein
MTTVRALALSSLVLTMIIAGIGLLDHGRLGSVQVLNQYGDEITTYGRGTYAHDSNFKAPIFRGSDLAMLAIVCPLLFVSILADARRSSARTRLHLVSLVACVTYYAFSVALGVSYNALLPGYIVLFSVSFFALIAGIRSFAVRWPTGGFPHRVANVFLALTGTVLIVAWVPDIVAAMIEGRPIATIEHYTTEITFVLDMGVVAPAAFIAIHLLRKQLVPGIVVLDMLLTLSLLMALMLPIQSLFQLEAGIEIPIEVLITKVATFCVLGSLAAFVKVRLNRSIKLTESGQA